MKIRYKIKNTNNRFPEEIKSNSLECNDGNCQNLKNERKMHQGYKDVNKERYRGMHWLLIIYGFKK